jgi:OOP family OmpA-OmpF porin
MTRILMLTMFVLVAFLIGVPASAQETDLEGSKDHPLISRYPGSFITEYKQEDFDEFELPLGQLKDGKGVKSQHLEGKITHILYQNPEGRSVLEIYRNFEGALRNVGLQVLYSCASAAQCGSGEFTGFAGQPAQWWNDSDPVRYLSAKLSRPQGDVFVSIHVQPGQYGTWLNVIETKPMEAGLVTINAASLADDISRSGHVSVYGIYFDTGKADVKPESDAAIKEIAKLLQQNASLKLHVVGHTDNTGDLVSNMDLSKRRADAVAKVLTGKYTVAAARLHADGVGPLSPLASNKTEEGRAKNRRVELVEQ